MIGKTAWACAHGKYPFVINTHQTTSSNGGTAMSSRTARSWTGSKAGCAVALSAPIASPRCSDTNEKLHVTRPSLNTSMWAIALGTRWLSFGSDEMIDTANAALIPQSCGYGK